jgi:shikimate kinase
MNGDWQVMRDGARLATRCLLFLVGYRGTGKTTTARLLSVRLGWGYVDADDVVEEQAGRTVREIFAAEGEAGFRARESVVLAGLCKGERQVVATGGGVVLAEANRRLLKSSGFVVWLTADAETIWQRMQADATTAHRRPNLAGGGLSEIAELLAWREPLYRDCADFTVDTTHRRPEDVVSVILAEVQG